MEWRLRRVVPAAAVTTHAKPYAQQQLSRDLEVERAAMGQRCQPQSFGEAIRSHVDGWISCELQLCYCTATKKRRVRACDFNYFLVGFAATAGGACAAY